MGAVAFETRNEMLQRVFESFGAIKSCHLLPDKTVPGKHRGYGFIEFEEERSALSAIERMDGFILLGRRLRVGWASNQVANGVTSAPPSLDDHLIKDALQRVRVRRKSLTAGADKQTDRRFVVTMLSAAMGTRLLITMPCMHVIHPPHEATGRP